MALHENFKIENCEANETVLEEIESLLRIVFNYAMQKDNFSFENPNNFLDDLKAIQELGGKTYIVKDNEKIIGTISYKFGNKNSWYHKGKCIMICHLAVLPEYQKLGIGKELLYFVENEVKDFDLPICLVTPEKNVRAIRFYSNKGYKKVMMGFSTDHYSTRFIKWLNEVPFDDKLIGKKYVRSAMQMRMKHYDVCNEFANKKLEQFWNERFSEHYINQPKEIQEDMFNTYLKRNISPINYLKRKEENEQNKRDME